MNWSEAMIDRKPLPWRKSTVLWLIGIGAAAFLLVLAYSRKPATFDWPTFPQEVIKAGRGAFAPARVGGNMFPGLLGASRRACPSPCSVDHNELETIEDPDDLANKSIRELIVLSNTAETSQERSEANAAIRGRDVDALEPLLALLQDDELPCSYAHSVANLLIWLGRADRDDFDVWRLPDGPVEDRPIDPNANRIIDAVVAYDKSYPDDGRLLANLAKILPLERLPEVIDWAEATSGNKQRGFITLFSTLTHANFPMIPNGFCGNSSPASIEAAIKRGEEAQRKSPNLMRTWWAENGEKPPSQWHIGSLIRQIESEKASRVWLRKEYAGQPDRLTHTIREQPYWSDAALGAYAFEPLQEKLRTSPYWLQPYIVGLIAQCDHPSRLAFLANLLNSTDNNLKFAAIESLGKLSAGEYSPQVREVLNSTFDTDLRQSAIRFLGEYGGKSALSDLANCLTSYEGYVAYEAQSVLERLLKENLAEVKVLAREHKDADVRRRLAEMLDRQSAVQVAENLEDGQSPAQKRRQNIAKLLKSNDSESRQLGIHLVKKHDLVELLPNCMDLLYSEKGRIQGDLVELILAQGIPGLNITNAEKLLGYSLKLDQQIALYCHAKYGEAALPLVRKIAFQWHDPAWPDETISVYPERKLFQILRDANEPNLDARIVMLAREVLGTNQEGHYLGLLYLLGVATPTDLIDELLNENTWDKQSRVFTAIRLIRRDRMTQYADQLATIAESQQSSKLLAIETLIEFESAHAWPAAARFLEGDTLNSRMHSLGRPGPAGAYAFGRHLSLLERAHRPEMLAMLNAELSGPMRHWIVVALTAALTREPQAVAKELLLTVAKNTSAPRAAQVLAAVALSHLSDDQCIPELKRLLRHCLQSECQTENEDCPSAEFVTGMTADIETIRLDVFPRKNNRRPPLEMDRSQRSIPDALRRLGDESMVKEAVEALISPKDEWNFSAYSILLQLKGMEGYRMAKERASQAYPEYADRLAAFTRDFFTVEMSRTDVMEILTFEEWRIPDEAVLIVKNDVREAVEPLADLFHECHDKRARYRTTILDVLCRFGDRRGLDLALDDPLLFADISHYLGDPPVTVANIGGFKFNRVQDALTLMEWYRGHRDSLTWDDSIKKFRLTEISGAG